MAEETQTLTMDESNPESGQFTEEEMDSLKVGEEMAEAEDSRLAGKYENAQELEKAYIELEKKLGEKSEEPPETEDGQKETVTDENSEEPSTEVNVLDKLWEERNDGFSDDTLQELAKTRPGELAKAYLQYRNQASKNEPKGLTEKDVEGLKGIVGGEEGYQNILSWAQSNLTENEQNMYDAVIDRGDPLSCYFAVQAIWSRYRDSEGSDGRLITGKPPSTKGDAFRSQAEVVRAMSDSRYENDAAYRKDIEQKLSRSNINF